MDGKQANIGQPFKIEFEADVFDRSSEWGLTNNVAENVCADLYGTDFLLTGGPVNKRVQWGTSSKTQMPIWQR